jgi:crossover junction endodeoxyribonuclease RuvC
VKVLGIDPGLATTGWGVVQRVSPQSFRVVRYGCLLTPARDPLVARLQSLARSLRELLEAEKPAAVAVEELFFSKNSNSAAGVGHARGVILLTLADAGLPVYEYNPRSVKIALTGFGGAEKDQMQKMVQRLLSLSAVPRPDDAADALAIALCHLNTHRLHLGAPLRGTGMAVRAPSGPVRPAGATPGGVGKPGRNLAAT